MATPRHCRGCGQVHDLLMRCPKPLPKTLDDLEKLKAFTKTLASAPIVSKPKYREPGVYDIETAFRATPARCPTCKQRIRKPKKRKKAKRA